MPTTPGWIELPKPPLQSVTSVTYRDTAGTLQTWAATNYVVDTPAGPRCRRGRLSLAYGISWPSTYGQASDITIRFVCGYGAAASSVPALSRQAMLMAVATFYATRENLIMGTIVATVPGGVDVMYRSYKSHPAQRAVA